MPVLSRITDKENTVTNNAPNRMRLNGGASRNSTRLGLATLYSAAVKRPAKIATTITTKAPSPTDDGIIVDGRMINVITKSARANAPGSLESTVSLPFFRPRTVLRRTLFPVWSRGFGTGCLNVATFLPNFRNSCNPTVMLDRTTEALLRHNHSSIAPIIPFSMRTVPIDVNTIRALHLKRVNPHFGL